MRLACSCGKTCELVWPPNSSLYASCQTNRQVVASGLKLNLRRDVHWVAKRLASFLTSTRRLSSILLANNRLMDVTQLALTWVRWPNGGKLASTCVQIWSRPKWAQVIASQRKCTQALAKRSWPKSSTCVNLCLRLARALRKMEPRREIKLSGSNEYLCFETNNTVVEYDPVDFIFTWLFLL